MPSVGPLNARKPWPSPDAPPVEVIFHVPPPVPVLVRTSVVLSVPELNVSVVSLVVEETS